MPNIDIILRAIGAQTVKSEMRGIADSAKSIGSEVKAIGASGGLRQAEAQAKAYWDTIDGARRETENLTRTLEGVRNAGIGMAAVGAAGIVLSNSLIQVAQESERADAKLTAMFAKRGEGGRIEELKNWASELSMQAAMVDDDPIKEAAAGLAGFGLKADQVKAIMPGLIGQSRLYNQSLDQTAEAFGRAFASGNAGALRRSGVTLSQADLDFIKSASTETEKQQRLFDAVKRSMDQYALSITEGLSEAEKASNRAKNQFDSMQTAIGKGAETAKASLEGLVASTLSLVTSNEHAAAGVGWVLTMGSYALTAGGSMVALAGQVGMVAMAFPGLAAKGVAAFVALRTAAVAFFTTTTVGFNAATIGVTALAAGVALAVSALLYSGAQRVGWMDKEQSFLDRLTAGWERLKGIITGTKVEWQQNEKDLQAEIDKRKASNAEAVLKGTKTQAQADEDNRKFEIQVRESFAREQFRVGDRANATKNQEAAAALKQGGAMPGMPGGAGGLQWEQDTDGTWGLYGPPRAGGVPAVGAASVVPGGGELDSLEAQKESIDDQMRQLKGKAHTAERAALAEQKEALDDQIKALKKQSTADKKKAAERKKAADKAAREAARLEREENDYTQQAAGVEAVKAEEAANTRIAQLEAERETARDEKNEAREKWLTYQIAAAQAQRDFDSEQIRAESIALEDERKAGYMMDAARAKRAGALQRALDAYNRPTRTTQGLGNLLKKLTTNRPSGTTTGPFNPYANHDSGVFATQYTGNSVYRDITQNLGPTQPLPSTMKAKQIGSYELANGGKRLLFEVMLPNFLRQDTATIPGG